MPARLPNFRVDLVVGALLLVLFLVPFITDVPLEYIRSFIGENFVESALAFVLLMFVATVVAPIAVPFAVPAAALVLGPWQAALLAILGWSLGAFVAYWIARKFGRRLIARIIDISRLDQLERFIPERHFFWLMVALRMMAPVDILSYALGLFPRIRWGPYVASTVLGIAPFAFIFAYMGGALLTSDYGRVVGLVGMGVVLLVLSWLIMTRKW